METLKNKKIIQYLLFSVTLFIILLRKYYMYMIKEYLISENVMSVLFYLSILFLGIQFLLNEKHNIKELFILLISILLYLFTREGSILLIILMAISIMNIDDEFVVKNYMIMSSIFIIGIIILVYIFPDIFQHPEIHYRATSNGPVLRETFGFANPNAAFFFTLPIYAGYIFLRFDKYNLYDRILLITMTVYIYQKTMSRTGFITVVISLIIIEIMKYIDIKKRKVYDYIIKFTIVIFMGLSILTGSILYKIEKVNNLLASRPSHWHAYIVEYGNLITLFGNKYSPIVKEMHPLDNSYIYMISMLGVFSFLFFSFLIYKGFDIFIKQNNKKYIAIVMMFLVYSIAENILLEAGYNFTIILLIKYVMKSSENEMSILEMITYLKNKIKRRAV